MKCIERHTLLAVIQTPKGYSPIVSRGIPLSPGLSDMCHCAMQLLVLIAEL